jgi:hypothetical protein
MEGYIVNIEEALSCLIKEGYIADNESGMYGIVIAGAAGIESYAWQGKLMKSYIPPVFQIRDQGGQLFVSVEYGDEDFNDPLWKSVDTLDGAIEFILAKMVTAHPRT